VVTVGDRHVVFANNLVAHIYPRKRRNTGIEFYLETGACYLIDLQTMDSISFGGVLRKANLAPLTVAQKFDERWVSG
jgi:hypothetical protein